MSTPSASAAWTILLALQRERLAAHDARHVEPSDGADGQEDQDEVAPEEDDQHDHEEDEGQGVEDVDEAHHHIVGAAAGIAGDRAVGDADHERDQRGKQTDGERDAAGDQRSGEEVAAVGVGAEEEIMPRDRRPTWSFAIRRQSGFRHACP